MDGVEAFPDPDASGQLTIDGVVNGSSIDPDGAGFGHALDACKDLEPSGFTGHGRTPQQQSRDLLRDHALAAAGIETLRFSHLLVARNPAHVAATLRAVARRRGLAA